MKYQKVSIYFPFNVVPVLLVPDVVLVPLLDHGDGDDEDERHQPGGGIDGGVGEDQGQAQGAQEVQIGSAEGKMIMNSYMRRNIRTLRSFTVQLTDNQGYSSTVHVSLAISFSVNWLSFVIEEIFCAKSTYTA